MEDSEVLRFLTEVCANKNDCHIVPKDEVQNAHLFGPFVFCCHRILRGVGAA